MKLSKAVKNEVSAEEEREKVTLELEKEILRHEIEKMKATSDFELLHLELSSCGSRSDTGPGHVKPKAMKLPVFSDAKDEIDSYFLRFERYAEAQNWIESEWVLNLSALLREKL